MFTPIQAQLSPPYVVSAQVCEVPLNGLLNESIVPVSSNKALSRARSISDTSFTSFTSWVTSIAREERKSGVYSKHQTFFLSHGHKTERAVIIFPGLSGRTEEMKPLAQALFTSGRNVLVLRNPHHGLPPNKGKLGDISVYDLERVAKSLSERLEQVGTRVDVGGVSMGSGTAMLTALRAKNVDRVVMVEPMFGLKGLPDRARGLVASLIAKFPDAHNWLLLGPRAPGGTTHGVAASGQIFLQVEAELKSAEKIPFKEVVVISDPLNTFVKQSTNDRVLSELKRKGVRVSTTNVTGLVKAIHSKDPVQNSLYDSKPDSFYAQPNVQKTFSRLTSLVGQAFFDPQRPISP